MDAMERREKMAELVTELWGDQFNQLIEMAYDQTQATGLPLGQILADVIEDALADRS